MFKYPSGGLNAAFFTTQTLWGFFDYIHLVRYLWDTLFDLVSVLYSFFSQSKLAVGNLAIYHFLCFDFIVGYVSIERQIALRL